MMYLYNKSPSLRDGQASVSDSLIYQSPPFGPLLPYSNHHFIIFLLIYTLKILFWW